MKKRVLVDLFGPIRVPNEYDLDVPIAPRQKNVQQHIEALREILHMLRHGTGYVHETEHDRLSDRLGCRLKTTITDVDWIDIRNATNFGLESFQFRQDLPAPHVIGLGESSLKLRNRLRSRSAQRDPARRCKSRSSAD